MVVLEEPKAMQYAIVTPSYGPDLERCRLLIESLECHVTGDFRHYVLVDARNLALFRALAGPRTEILTVESVMPWWLRRLPAARRWWFSFKSPPVRNWVFQQLVKLSVANYLDCENYVFVDSDVVFVKPFSVNELSPAGKLRLFRVPGAAREPTHYPWHRTAARLLGLPATEYFGSTYIGNLITWRRDNLKAMYRRIEDVHGRPWLETVCQYWHLSEYILHGIFVEHVLGPAANQEYSDVPLCHISWTYRLESDEDLARFFSEIRPHHVAVMVSSKQGLEVPRYRHLVTPRRAAITCS